MKHCHFSILWNEIAFLKQKMQFMYDNFDQLIFYDLNIKTDKFSDDGGHEFIKNFPDPEGKITLIEKKDLSDVEKYGGRSFKKKQKMFAVGSEYVKDDIDFFWCTDMDEFFTKSLMDKVEKNIKPGQAALVPHLIFYKNERWVLSTNKKKTIDLPWPRIARHKKGNIYQHCGLDTQFKVVNIGNEFLFHFAHVGPERIKYKTSLYGNSDWYNNVWKKFDENQKGKPGQIIGSNMHSIIKAGVRLNSDPIPKYIDVDQLMKDLKVR